MLPSTDKLGNSRGEPCPFPAHSLSDIEGYPRTQQTSCTLTHTARPCPPRRSRRPPTSLHYLRDNIRANCGLLDVAAGSQREPAAAPASVAGEQGLPGAILGNSGT